LISSATQEAFMDPLEPILNWIIKIIPQEKRKAQFQA
jgi:hypothetical protein